MHNKLGSFLDSTYFLENTGLPLTRHFKELGIKTSGIDEALPSFSIQDLNLISRVGPNGALVNQVVFSVIQKSGISMRNGKVIGHFTPDSEEEFSKGKFVFRGGTTLIFDLDTFTLKYVISKPMLDLQHLARTQQETKAKKITSELLQIDKKKVEKQFKYLSQMGRQEGNEYRSYFGVGPDDYRFNEPFGFLHKHNATEDL